VTSGWPAFDRQQIAAIVRRSVALWFRHRLRVIRKIVTEQRTKELAEGGIKRVKPDRRRRTEMAVIMPAPARGQNQIAGLHDDPLSFYRRVGALTLDNEAQCVLRVSMCRRDLAGSDHLQPAKQRVGDEAGFRESRILQHQHAAFGLFRGDDRNRPEELGT
jgi:hypothetical protein